ncbi:MAG: urease accessory protein UreD [Rhodoferax sp.]|nr:urease accessory protein UreD [Rhodoferax sp.]
MPWLARLDLNYQLASGRTVARHTHSGPLRILQSLYPEGDAICHNVLVHPPGGLVGGDTLDIHVDVGPQAQGLITTPGATRFYRSEGQTALQSTHLQLQADARLEWLPLESICYSGCLAENRLTMELAPGAELMGWDITALGLPAARQPFTHGMLRQHIELPGIWLERGTLDASDLRLLDGPVGLAGHRCMASIFFVAGTALSRPRRQEALDRAQEVIAAHTLAASAGVTSPNPQVIVARVLAPVVESATDMLRQLRASWRVAMWNSAPINPRIWAM